MTLILNLIVLATAFPVGWFLAWLCSDEIVPYRRYMLVTLYLLIIVGFMFAVFFFRMSILLSFVYMVIVMFMLLRKPKIKKRR